MTCSFQKIINKEKKKIKTCNQKPGKKKKNTENFGVIHCDCKCACVC